MKRELIIVLLVLNIFFIYSADDVSDINQSEVEEIQQTIDNYVPINDDGEFDPSDYRSKAEGRIAKINEYVGPFSKLLLGVELSMSWVFVFSIVTWILIIEMIMKFFGRYLHLYLWGCFVFGVVASTIFMHSLGPELVEFMDTTLINNIIVLVCLIFGWAIYTMVINTLVKNREKKEKEKERVDRRTLSGLTDNAIGIK